MPDTSLLPIFKEDGYRIGNLQVLLYDRKRPDVFPPPYLTKLYNLCKTSGRRSSQGILPTFFCGMEDISHDAITSYLADLPIILFIVWSDQNTFKEAGFAFPVLFRGRSPERMCFAAYGFFREFWGKPEAPTLMLLGLSFLFQEFGLNAIHGIRYEENRLTAKFMADFGFREVGRVPRYMVQNGKLVPGVVTSLTREDFEAVAAFHLVQLHEKLGTF